MAKKPIKYLPNDLEKPKQKAPFFERFGKRIQSYVTKDFNIGSIVKVKDNAGNVMTSKETKQAINAKDKHGNVLLDVQNPTFDFIAKKSYLNADKTINVKKALNPFRAVDVAIKALKYSVARAVDKDVASMGAVRSKLGAMIIKGVVQAIVLPLELPVKALKNMTDAGINSVVNTVKKLQASRAQKEVVTKNDVLGQDKNIQVPQQENSKAQSIAKGNSTPEIATTARNSVVELGHSTAVQHIHKRLHNEVPPPPPPPLSKNPSVGVKPVQKPGQDNDHGR